MSACRKNLHFPGYFFILLTLRSLAYCELYVTLGTFFRRFSKMELHVFETTRDDLDFEDFFSGYYIAGKKWFKAVGR